MDIKETINTLSSDVIFYHGPINRDGYDKVSTALETRKSQRNSICLVLVTYGGDPNSAYRIARALNHHYSSVEVLIPDVCKSAGTLLCIGAHKLIFGDRGELGPLDIQLSKPDELFESMSGLDIIQALSALQEQVLQAFRDYLVDIRGGAHLRTKLAADIAAKLADGFIAPIAAKIDPVTLGEHQRAMQIAFDYGQRLNEMSDALKKDALMKLIGRYPSHGFVIDRKEASELFKRIERPTDDIQRVYEWSRIIIPTLPASEEALVIDLTQGMLDDTTHETSDAKSIESDHSANRGSSPTKRAGRKGKSNKQDSSKPSRANTPSKSRTRKANP